MEILAYEPSLLDEIAAVYNESSTGTPYCYPVTPTYFESLVPTEGSPLPELQSEHMFVARDRGEAVGFVHCGAASPDWQKDRELRPGAIRFLCQRPGDRPAGTALVEAAEAWLRDQGADIVLAFHQDPKYPFYHLAHSYLSDRLAHVFALLGANGYSRSHGEVYLDWDSYPSVDPGPPPVEVELKFEWRERGEANPGLTLVAMKGNQPVGVCHNNGEGAPFRPPEAANWFMTHWLGVDEPFRQQGLAQYLLSRTRFEMHARGYRRAVISTNWQNYRAMLLYSNYGYRVADWTYGFTKTLEE